MDEEKGYMKNNIVFYLKWFATFITIVGAVCTALNIYPASPILLSIGSVAWLAVSIIWREWSLIVINATLLAIYTVLPLVKYFLL
jgi:hypothetical protein